jgi:hypothetical protein
MITRDERIAQFTTEEEPGSDIALELLCEDHRGTYALPFPCRHTGGEWFNQTTGEVLESEIVGWRVWKGAQASNPRMD